MISGALTAAVPSIEPSNDVTGSPGSARPRSMILREPQRLRGFSQIVESCAHSHPVRRHARYQREHFAQVLVGLDVHNARPADREAAATRSTRPCCAASTRSPAALLLRRRGNLRGDDHVRTLTGQTEVISGLPYTRLLEQSPMQHRVDEHRALGLFGERPTALLIAVGARHCVGENVLGRKDFGRQHTQHSAAAIRLGLPTP